MKGMQRPGAPKQAWADSAALRSLQRSFLAAVTGPADLPSGSVAIPDPSTPVGTATRHVAAVLTAGPRLTAIERLGIYRTGYRARLVECLADDYPALQHLLGESAFEAAAGDYIRSHPSASPSLNAFGRSMPAFLAERGGPLGAFAADLARLEWAVVEAIHAAPSPPLSMDRLERLAPEQWATAHLVPAAAVRVLRLTHPVNLYYQGFRDGAGPTVPQAAPSMTLVHRTGWVVYRRDLAHAAGRLLEAVVAGEPLGRALAAVASDDDRRAEGDVTRWFREWVSDGVFTRIEARSA